MIQVLRIADLNVRECLKMQKRDAQPFAVIGNRTRIPLFIGVPCDVDTEKDELGAYQEAHRRLGEAIAEMEDRGDG